jgi:hypothetical protein
MPCDLFDEIASSIPEDEQMEHLRNSRMLARTANLM